MPARRLLLISRRVANMVAAFESLPNWTLGSPRSPSFGTSQQYRSATLGAARMDVQRSGRGVIVKEAQTGQTDARRVADASGPHSRASHDRILERLTWPLV